MATHEEQDKNLELAKQIAESMKKEKKTYWQFIRTCQECGHKQTDTEPEYGKATDKWLEKKCKKCKSEALDYGSLQEFDDKGNPVIHNDEEEI